MLSLRSHPARRLYTMLALVSIGAAPAIAHDRGVLRLGTRRLAPGAVVALTGLQFSRGATLQLALVGTGVRHAVGSVRTDSAGRFADSLRVPLATAPATYRLVALAADGDEVASLTLQVVAAAPPTPAADEHAGHDEPTAEPLALTHARSPQVTAGMIASIVLAVAAAALLLRPPRSPQPGAQS